MKGKPRMVFERQPQGQIKLSLRRRVGGYARHHRIFVLHVAGGVERVLQRISAGTADWDEALRRVVELQAWLKTGGRLAADREINGPRAAELWRTVLADMQAIRAEQRKAA